MKKIIKKYLVEGLFLLIALFFTIVSFLIIFQTKNENKEEKDFVIEKERKPFSKNKIYIDISGSVNKPGLYQLPEGSRIKDALDKAQGLSENADKNFFYRNFNLARILNDQEKIYIPSIWEVQSGLFIENPYQLNFNLPNNQKNETTTEELININEATIEELDSLPGIGKITAQKIIDNRPYEKIEDLLNKKIINKSTYEKIKNLITL